MYKKNPDIIFRQIAGEAILVPIRRNTADLEKIYTLNEAGSCIWRLLDGNNTIDRIKQKLFSEFDTAFEILSADVDEFLALLLNNEIIQESQ